MAKLEDALTLLYKIRDMIIPDGIKLSDVEEVVPRTDVIGSNMTRKTGNRVLTIQIPYCVTQEYLMQQLLLAQQRRKELAAEQEEIDHATRRIKVAMGFPEDDSPQTTNT